MEALVGLGVALVSLGLFFWAINALSVLRNQMDDVIERLDRIERGQRDASARSGS